MKVALTAISQVEAAVAKPQSIGQSIGLYLLCKRI